jgi:hypothetical protein
MKETFNMPLELSRYRSQLSGNPSSAVSFIGALKRRAQSELPL